MAKKTTTPTIKESSTDLSWVLLGLHVTEKASEASMHNAYTFKVSRDANKMQIAQAVALYYQVTPRRITTVRMATRPKTVRGRNGTERGYKKALVFLKKGDTITFV